MPNDNLNLISSTIINSTSIKDDIPEGVKLIGAPKFWEKGRKGEGVIIAIIDTGCDVTHPDLEDRIVGIRNFTTDDGSNKDIVTDYVGHGTHVAGIIAANENGSGIIGVAPRAKILILKALSKNGGSYNWVVNAINYAVSKKVDIISMSLGGKFDDRNLHNAIKEAVKKDILVVCAAGNDGDRKKDTVEISYPAGYNEVISVGSINLNRKSSRFSASNNEVDLVAPGQGLDDRGIMSTAPGNKYVEMQGTSMATPHVAGALALIINWAKEEFGRDLTEVEIYAQLIKRTVSLGYDKRIEGNGMLFLDIDDIFEKIKEKEIIAEKVKKSIDK